MPQMAPMSWIYLYIFFSILFLLFNFMNYYMFLKQKDSKLINITIKKKNWKW